MDFFEVINKRYTYRGEFKKDKIPYEDIKLILNSAVLAPVGMGINTTSYIVVTDEKVIEQVSKWIPGVSVSTAPLIMVLVSENFAESCGANFEVENYAVATENMLLAITALGYATMWTDAVLKSPQVNGGVRDVLNIPENKTLRVVLPIGIPVDIYEPQIREEREEIEEIEGLVIFQKYED